MMSPIRNWTLSWGQDGVFSVSHRLMVSFAANQHTTNCRLSHLWDATRNPRLDENLIRVKSHWVGFDRRNGTKNVERNDYFYFKCRLAVAHGLCGRLDTMSVDSLRIFKWIIESSNVCLVLSWSPLNIGRGRDMIHAYICIVNCEMGRNWKEKKNKKTLSEMCEGKIRSTRISAHYSNEPVQRGPRQWKWNRKPLWHRSLHP